MTFQAFGQFTTQSANPTPAMTVTVTRDGKEVKTYRTPKGFRLNQYVASQHQDKTVKVTFPVRADGGKPDCLVEVLDENGAEFERHLGVYDKADE